MGNKIAPAPVEPAPPKVAEKPLPPVDVAMFRKHRAVYVSPLNPVASKLPQHARHITMTPCDKLGPDEPQFAYKDGLESSPTMVYAIDFDADRHRYLTDNVLDRVPKRSEPLTVLAGDRPDVLVVSKQDAPTLRFTDAQYDVEAMEDMIYAAAGLQRF